VEDVNIIKLSSYSFSKGKFMEEINIMKSYTSISTWWKINE